MSLKPYLRLLAESNQIQRVRSPEKAVDWGFAFFAGIVVGLLLAYVIARVG